MGLYYADGKGKAIKVLGAPRVTIFKSITLWLDNPSTSGVTSIATKALPAGTMLSKESGELISIENLTAKVLDVLKTSKTIIDKAEVVKILTDNGFDKLYTLYTNESGGGFAKKTDFDSDNKPITDHFSGKKTTINHQVIDDTFKIVDSSGKDVSGGALGQDVTLVWDIVKAPVFVFSTTDILPNLYSGNGGPK